MRFPGVPSLVIGLALALPGLPGVAAAQSNVALNKPATSSSTEGSLLPHLAVDGQGSTRWGSGFGSRSATDVEWLQLDLGSLHDLASARITWEAAYAERFEIQVSNDGASYQTVLGCTSAGGTNDIALAGISGRYVRILLTRKHLVWGAYWGYSIWEWQVTGVPRTPLPAVGTTWLDRPLRLVTWNIQHGDRDDDVRDIATQMDLLAGLGADVIILQEMHTWDGDYPRLYREGISSRTGVAWNGYYASSTGAACGGPEGNMILTRLPMVSYGSARLVASSATPCDRFSTRVVLRVELSVNNRVVHVFGTHLDTDPGYRAPQFSQLNAFMSGFSGDKLLGGDFNTTPEESSLWSLIGGYPDAWADLVYWGDTGYTHHAYANTPPGKRVDYWRRAGANLLVREISVIQTKRSDHNPVVVDVDVRR